MFNATAYDTKTDDQLRAIAEGLIDDTIFTDRHIIPDEATIKMPHVFKPLATLPQEKIQEMKDANVNFIFEYNDKAVSYNGKSQYPTFESFQMLNEEDTDRMLSYYDEFIREEPPYEAN